MRICTVQREEELSSCLELIVPFYLLNLPVVTFSSHTDVNRTLFYS